MPGRSPESAPRCPRCGYLLFGATDWRCPECGYRMETDDEVNRAWELSDDNRENRHAVLAEWLAAILGGVMLLSAVVLFAVERCLRLIPLLILTLAALNHRWRMREPMYGLLLALGAIWFVIGALVWALL